MPLTLALNTAPFLSNNNNKKNKIAQQNLCSTDMSCQSHVKERLGNNNRQMMATQLTFASVNPSKKQEPWKDGRKGTS